ncbi:hypothetical protein M0805_008169 [Coniferiporia weirii]|nr:hypothetical protein M0805_008169 [Coniferiporia weirii]
MSASALSRSARRTISVVSHSRVGTAPVAKFHSSRRYSSSVHANDPDVLENEKKRNLSGQQHKTSTTHDDAPGWNEYLASSSEAAVKADRSGPNESEANGRETMQRRTVEHIKARHHGDDVTSGTVEAQYERDEIQGPLKGKGKEK